MRRELKPDDPERDRIVDHTRVREALYAAAAVGGLAPSVFNSQPWRWRIDGEKLHLHVDASRATPGPDPLGHMMTVSCGAALHHARLSLAAAGYRCEFTGVPDPAMPDLVATVAVTGTATVTDDDIRRFHTIFVRQTDRRAFAPGPPVAATVIGRLRAAAEAEGAILDRLSDCDVSFLATAASSAAAIQDRDARYRRDLERWTTHPRGGDGMPDDTIVAANRRRVPLRDFGTGAGAPGTMQAFADDDAAATYLVLSTADDSRVDWLSAGQATSAVLLEIATSGLAASPMSDVIEVPGARALIRALLPRRSYPHLVVRVGPPRLSAPASAPRRPARQTIDAD